jgi:hypothetical protein
MLHGSTTGVLDDLNTQAIVRHHLEPRACWGHWTRTSGAECALERRQRRQVLLEPSMSYRDGFAVLRFMTDRPPAEHGSWYNCDGISTFRSVSGWGSSYSAACKRRSFRATGLSPLCTSVQ